MMIFSEAIGRLDSMARATAALVPGLLVALLLFGLGLLVARGIRSAVRRAAAIRQASPGSAAVLGRIAGGVTTLVAFLIAASVAFPSVSAADLFNLLGIGGVAIGFAFRDVLQNLLAGILILLTRPFVIGDQIRAGSYEGTVDDVWVRATVLRTYDNQRVLIPNATLFTDKITIITAFEKRRLSFPLTVGNGDDIGAAKAAVVEALRGTEGILNDPAPEALVTGLGASGVDMVARFWINPPRRRDAMDGLDAAIASVKGALTARGIDLPYPTTQILFHDQTEETDGDRTRQREGWPAGQNPPRSRFELVREHAASPEQRSATGPRVDALEAEACAGVEASRRQPGPPKEATSSGAVQNL